MERKVPLSSGERSSHQSGGTGYSNLQYEYVPATKGFVQIHQFLDEPFLMGTQVQYGVYCLDELEEVRDFKTK
jgi:hypothetical protein